MTPEWYRENGRRAATIRWSRRLFRFCSVEECGVELPLDWKGVHCTACKREKDRDHKRRKRQNPAVRAAHNARIRAHYAKNAERMRAEARARYWRRKLEGAAS